MFEDFLRWLRERYAPARVMLFGSRASGEPLASSDYDLLVVSKAFEGVPFTDRMTAIYLRWDLPQDLDCLCLTPDEFESASKKISLVREIARHGVAV